MVTTPDLFHMLVHLLQLGSHMRAVHVVGVTNMIYTQVVPNHHIPLCWLPDAWYQVLQHCTAKPLTASGSVLDVVHFKHGPPAV